MSTFSRVLNLQKILKNKSHFLFGPRQTGKTSLVRMQLPDAIRIDLLDEDEFLALQNKPTSLRERIQKAEKIVIIDEIQRVPALLNEVHRLIESQSGLRFLLTGSSAVKLRRKGVNLLGGRARSLHLHPFVSAELGKEFDLGKALLYGSLPSIYLSDQPRQDVKAYVGEYLREEIAMEALTRNLQGFSRFLEVAALSNGQLINYQKIANDAQIKRSTTQNYFDILIDTLIAHPLEPYLKTKSRKAIATSKFYFFDLGIVNYLKGLREIPRKTSLFGDALEAYIHHELRSWVDYSDDGELKYWRSTSDFEVDFILNESIAIECKGSDRILADDIKGLRALGEEKKMKKKIVVSMESKPRNIGDIEVLPYAVFLEQLWSGEFS